MATHSTCEIGPLKLNFRSLPSIFKLFALLSLFLFSKDTSAEAPVVTSIGFMFETFSPYTLIRFFEFSDREWNITEGCFGDMYEYVEGLRHNEYWALKCKYSLRNKVAWK